MAEAAVVDGEGETADVSAVSYFFDRAHDEFMNKLHEDFASRYGGFCMVLVMVFTQSLTFSSLETLQCEPSQCAQLNKKGVDIANIR